MAIQINTGYVNLPAGGTGERPLNKGGSGHGHSARPAAHVNHIPSPESLDTMIRAAIADRRNGRNWERGTILNLKV